MARRKRELSGTSLDNKAGGFDIIGAAVFDDAVQLYQSQLLDLGYNLGKSGADGKYGADTIKAIKAFQAKEGLPQTGVMDPVTMQRLAKRVSEKRSASPSSNLDAVLLEDMLKSGLPSAADVVKSKEVAAANEPTAVATTSSAPAADDKILGLPKNVAIGGGVALGVLALLGLYLMMKKSGSQSEEGFVDDSGRRWELDENGDPTLSDSLAERMERHRRLSPYRAHRRPSYR